MKKINLKSILKKTFKKKKKTLPKKTKQISKKSKNIKIKKKIGRPKSKQISKNSLKEKVKTNLPKQKNTENLRLTKNQDQKPEIIKIKKQETEKKIFKPKDYIVYPKHGVGQILSDGKSDIYDNNLMRRLAGLLYLDDKIVGKTKVKVLSDKK